MKTSFESRFFTYRLVNFLVMLITLVIIKYPPIWRDKILIKIILDNHSYHISGKTKNYLKEIPGGFYFVCTPAHSSWLNLIEVFFNKMTRSFPKGTCVSSKDELRSRILQYLG